MRKKGTIDLMVAQSGTILGIVNEFFISGDFISITGKVTEGEKVVGELTDFEKALSSAVDRITDDYNKLVDREFGQERLSSENIKVVALAHRRVQNDRGLLNTILWDSIKRRLYPSGNEELDVISLREGFKIVAVEEKDHNCESCSLPLELKVSCPVKKLISMQPAQ